MFPLKRQLLADELRRLTGIVTPWLFRVAPKAGEVMVRPVAKAPIFFCYKILKPIKIVKVVMLSKRL